MLEDPRADQIMMFDFADRADKYLFPPSRFASQGSDKLVPGLPKFNSR